jgi:shikimate kinase
MSSPDGAVGDSFSASCAPRNPGAPAPERNIVLVGMPGSGKTTIGRRAAARTGRPFLDTDDLIETATGASLRAVLELEGREGFLLRERRAAESVVSQGAVVATGGSIVYGDAAMAALAGGGTVVFLRLSLQELEDRIRDLDRRGVVRAPGQTLAQLFTERQPLYRRWAEITLDCDGRSAADLAQQVAQLAGPATGAPS